MHMSKHKKRRSAATGRDGYTNSSAFLGEASPLLSDGTFVRSGLSDNLVSTLTGILLQVIIGIEKHNILAGGLLDCIFSTLHK